jgi:hypothetical protein
MTDERMKLLTFLNPLDTWGAVNLDKSWKKIGMNLRSERETEEKIFKWLCVARAEEEGYICREEFSPGWCLQPGLKVHRYQPGLKVRAWPAWPRPAAAPLVDTNRD